VFVNQQAGNSSIFSFGPAKTENEEIKAGADKEPWMNKPSQKPKKKVEFM